MKKSLLILSMAVIISLNCKAQDRIDSNPPTLTYKSKEITAALYWSKNTKTGRWESRKNTKLVYLGEGVAVDNFNSLFIGEYEGQRHLFLDFREYSWTYHHLNPEVKDQWVVSPTLMAALLSDDDYSRLSSLTEGETLTIMPRYYRKMYKGHPEYSFSLFLRLVETMRSSSELSYKYEKKEYGEDYAESQWKKDYQPIYFMALKRVLDANGRDMVRFALYPQANLLLIDKYYFEVEYSVYRNLFTEDKTKSYK